MNVFAGGMGQPRILVAREDGTIFITRSGTDVVAIKDDDVDGKADRCWKVFPYLKMVHGLAFRGTTMYLATDNKLFTAELQQDGTAGKPEELVGDLPDAGQHPNRALAFGPDGMLYLSVGSTCNACDDANEENATLLKMAPDGSGRTIVARGLRNTIGWGWHPETGQIWGMDHGSDWRTSAVWSGWPSCRMGRCRSATTRTASSTASRSAGPGEASRKAPGTPLDRPRGIVGPEEIRRLARDLTRCQHSGGHGSISEGSSQKVRHDGEARSAQERRF